MIVFALSTGHEIGLGLVGLAFVTFALVTSMVVPRFRPGFPGNVSAFVGVTACMFAAMLAAVYFFGKETHAVAEASPPAQTTTAATTTTAPAATTTPAASGNVSAGKAIFASAGCAGCHTLKAAGATGTTGPDLDQLKPSAARVVKQVTDGGKIMPSFKSSLSTQQIQDVAAYVAAVAGKS